MLINQIDIMLLPVRSVASYEGIWDTNYIKRELTLILRKLLLLSLLLFLLLFLHPFSYPFSPYFFHSCSFSPSFSVFFSFAPPCSSPIWWSCWPGPNSRFQPSGPDLEFDLINDDGSVQRTFCWCCGCHPHHMFVSPRKRMGTLPRWRPRPSVRSMRTSWSRLLGTHTCLQINFFLFLVLPPSHSVLESAGRQVASRLRGSFGSRTRFIRPMDLLARKISCTLVKHNWSMVKSAINARFLSGVIFGVESTWRNPHFRLKVKSSSSSSAEKPIFYF